MVMVLNNPDLEQQPGTLAVSGERGPREVKLLEGLGHRLGDPPERRARRLLPQRLGVDERADVEVQDVARERRPRSSAGASA